MFIACPHCRYLVATDPRTQQPPQHCPRCGGLLDPATSPQTAGVVSTDPQAASTGQSFVSLLRRDEPDTAADHDQIDAMPDAPVSPFGSHPHVADAPALQEDGDDENRMIADAVRDASSPVSDKAGEDTAATSLAGAAIADDGSAPAEPAQPAGSIGPATSRAPSFLRSTRSSAAAARVPRWQWILLAVLSLSLILQVLLADRARLAANAGWRPLIVSLCGVFRCPVPPWREPQAFAMLDRDVRPVADAPGVLLAQATFRNDARWSQPWPILVLTLKDADGRTLGARAIAPADYLQGEAATGELAPGQSAQVAVRIREPSANVVAFSFDFR